MSLLCACVPCRRWQLQRESGTKAIEKNNTKIGVRGLADSNSMMRTTIILQTKVAKTKAFAMFVVVDDLNDAVDSQTEASNSEN